MTTRNSTHFIVGSGETLDVDINPQSDAYNNDASFDITLDDNDRTVFSVTFESTDAQTGRERLKAWGLAFARQILEATTSPSDNGDATRALDEIAARSKHPSYRDLGPS